MQGIGMTDNIHGYNPDYQRTAARGGQFGCFAFPGRDDAQPGRFCRRPVGGPYTPTPSFPASVPDHQGHIVPHTLLSCVLEPIAMAVSRALDGGRPGRALTFDNVAHYLETHYPELRFDAVNRYIRSRLIAGVPARKERFVSDGRGKALEARVGGYFSVLIWNPANLCRAPCDSERAGYPGERVDAAVRSYLLINGDTPGLTAAMSDAFDDVGNEPTTVAEVTTFIAACNVSLTDPIDRAKGYYVFPWRTFLDAAVLTPDS